MTCVFAENEISRDHKKDPRIAVILSIFFPGLGQIYNGELKKGICVEAGAIIGLFILLVPSIIIGVYAIYDAYTTATKINSGLIQGKPMKWSYPVLYLLVYIGISIIISYIFIEWIFQGNVPEILILTNYLPDFNKY